MSRTSATSQASPTSRTVATVAALFVFGLAVNLFYGRRGFMPLDQGIVFDGAWRLLSGQMPFRDFVAPNGLVPSLMQVPFFKWLGVTWFAFCLHASIINGCFCALAYSVLRLCEATRVEAAFYSAASAFYFYPPNGTPFMDQHAFFFVVLMLAAVVVGTLSPTPSAERLSWFLVPILFVLAFLSKQIPTAFAALGVAAWIVVNPRRARRWVTPLVAGTVVVLLSIVVLRWRLPFSITEAFTYLVLMPFGTGAERTTGSGVVAPVRLILGTMRRLPAWSHQWSMYVPLAGVVALIAGFRVIERWRLYAWLLATLFFCTGAFLAYTVNQLEDGFGLLMLMAGLGAVAVRQTAARVVPGRFGAQLASALAIVIAAVAVRDTAIFAATVDATRSVLDTNYSAALADRGEKSLPPALRFMRWTPINCEPEEFAELVRFLSASDANFVLISDLTPLYALTGKASVGPALWLHPGLSTPQSGTAAFDRFETDLIGRMQTFNVRWIVLDEPHTLRGVSLGDFPKLRALVLARDCGERYFGQVRVIDLCKP